MSTVFLEDRCPACGGQGVVAKLDHWRPQGAVMVDTTCDTCEGLGVVECAKCIEDDEKCRECLEEEEWNRLNP